MWLLGLLLGLWWYLLRFDNKHQERKIINWSQRRNNWWRWHWMSWIIAKITRVLIEVVHLDLKFEFQVKLRFPEYFVNCCDYGGINKEVRPNKHQERKIINWSQRRNNWWRWHWMSWIIAKITRVLIEVVHLDLKFEFQVKLRFPEYFVNS